MTDHIQDDELEPDADESEETEDFERAPQPGNTPAPGEPPLDLGAITGGRLADDH
jgi:hypothetical protein